MVVVIERVWWWVTAAAATAKATASASWVIECASASWIDDRLKTRIDVDGDHARTTKKRNENGMNENERTKTN